MSTAEETGAHERNFAGQLRRAREAQGMSQAELARRATAYGAPMKQQTVAKIEGAGQSITLDQAGALSMALGRELADMLRPPVEQLTAAEVRSKLAAAQRRVEELETELAGAVREQEQTQAQIDQERARVRQAESSLKAAQDNLARLEKLNASGQGMTVEITEPARLVVDPDTFRIASASVAVAAIDEARARGVPDDQIAEMVERAFEEHSKTAAAAKAGD